MFNKKAAGVKFPDLLNQVRVLDQQQLEQIQDLEPKIGIDGGSRLLGASKADLECAYEEFERTYKPLVMEIARPGKQMEISDGKGVHYVNTNCEFENKYDLHIEEVRRLVTTMKAMNPNRTDFSHTFSKQAQETGRLLAFTFAMWSYTKAFADDDGHADDEGGAGKSNTGGANALGAMFIMQPHPSQVLSILCMLGVGSESLVDQLSQVKTGEGKSISLGMLATMFALFDFSVQVVSFSKYLAERDESAFKGLFKRYQEPGLIKKQITYLNIGELGDFAMENGIFTDTRAMIDAFFRGKTQQPALVQWNKGQSVLLIDEVDVFFGEHFYGKVRSPCHILSGKNVMALVKAAWDNRENAGSGNGEFERAMERSKAAILREFPRLKDILPSIFRAMDKVLGEDMWEGGDRTRGLKMRYEGNDVGADPKEGIYYKNPATGDRERYGSHI
jgi:hypothetical protein